MKTRWMGSRIFGLAAVLAAVAALAGCTKSAAVQTSTIYVGPTQTVYLDSDGTSTYVAPIRPALPHRD